MHLIFDMNVIPDPLPQPSPRFILITQILPRDFAAVFGNYGVGRKFKKTYAIKM
jgi:hypothetical protein